MYKLFKFFSGKQKVLGRYSIQEGKIIRILRPQSWTCHRLAHDCESSLKNFMCFSIVTGNK